MTKRRAVITVGTALLIGVLAAVFVLAPRETDVYAAALAQFPDRRPLIVSRPGTCSAGNDVSGVPPELLQRFLLANGPGASAISLLPMQSNYDIGSSTPMSGNLTYPGGRRPLYLSRVGYNEDRTEALFCAEANAGFLFYLRKQHGTWQVIRASPTWMSSVYGKEIGADV